MSPTVWIRLQGVARPNFKTISAISIFLSPLFSISFQLLGYLLYAETTIDSPSTSPAAFSLRPAFCKNSLIMLTLEVYDDPQLGRMELECRSCRRLTVQILACVGAIIAGDRVLREVANQFCSRGRLLIWREISASPMFAQGG